MTVHSEERDRLAVIALESARGNAVDRAMLTRLEELLRELASRVEGGDEKAPRAVVLRGAGEKSFSTGYNVEELIRELREGPSVTDEASHPLELALRALDECPVPTVALVHGTAYGAGCELACACDLRVLADDARLCMPPAKLGVLYSATGIQRLVDLAGLAAVREMFFTGEPVAAPRALALGLANRVVPKGEATSEAEKLAATIAANAPLSVRGTKTVLRRLRPPPLDAAARAELAGLRDRCFRSRDFAEATQAFLEKRPPRFEGR
jgi:enoyl-CoA hydratase/carnithine racemase